MASNEQEVLRTLEEQADPRHTALVIVDVQNDFVHPEGVNKSPDYWEKFPQFPKMLERLPRLLEAARKADNLIIFVRGIYDPQYIAPPFVVAMERMGLYGRICISGTFGADFFGDIRPAAESSREVIVTKHRYSAFWGTDLDMILRSNGIKTLVMTGTSTSTCVESTTRDAFFNDYYVVLAEDCCADRSEQLHQAMLQKVKGSFGLVVSSDEIMDVWSANVLSVER